MALLIEILGVACVVVEFEIEGGSPRSTLLPLSFSPDNPDAGARAELEEGAWSAEEEPLLVASLSTELPLLPLFLPIPGNIPGNRRLRALPLALPLPLPPAEPAAAAVPPPPGGVYTAPDFLALFSSFLVSFSRFFASFLDNASSFLFRSASSANDCRMASSIIISSRSSILDLLLPPTLAG